MKVYILGNEFDIRPSQSILSELDGIVKNFTTNSSQNFSHMVIDGKDVHDHRAYIIENMSKINTIEIVLETEKGLVKNMLSSVQGDIDRIIIDAKELSKDFAENTDRNAFMDLVPLFGKINAIFNSFNEVETDQNLNDKVSDYEAWNEYAKEVHTLSDKIKSLQSIMRDNDVPAISEALVSDIVPVLENMKDKILNLI